MTERHSTLGRPLRFVVFGGSITSDWGNPAATSTRAVLSAIARAGHEVTFLEQRGNHSLTELLRHRGSRGYKAFTSRYPEIQFRTYDLQRGWERIVWFGREIATADVVIALPGTPESLLPEIAALNSSRVVRLVDESFGMESAEVQLVRATGAHRESHIVFGPAVAMTTRSGTVRSGHPLLVAYDDVDAAESTRMRLNACEPVLIQTGAVDLPGWTYVPEVELPDKYAASLVAVIIGEGDTPWSPARRALPLASGCHVVEPDTDHIAAVRSSTEIAEVPQNMNATIQAANLIATASRLLGQKRAR